MNYGPITADYDWCEQNFKITSYIAEFYNTISSVPIAFGGFFFLKQALQYNYGTRFILSSLALAIIGIGSIAFHGTLTRAGQVLVEVPMLFGSLLFLYVSSCNAMSVQTENKWSNTLAIVLTCLGIVSLYFYFYVGFVYFILIYTATVALLFLVTLYHLNPHSQARKYAITAIGFYAGGFLCFWIPEQVMCGNRLVDHHETGLLALPVPLHAFFHITSAIGPVCMLTYLSFEHLAKRKRNPTIDIETWMCNTVHVPYVIPTQSKIV
jgi:dihydroceramidase